jgi:aryl-phospho-beta-D-glucosidase BglC (GH1 family)
MFTLAPILSLLASTALLVQGLPLTNSSPIFPDQALSLTDPDSIFSGTTAFDSKLQSRDACPEDGDPIRGVNIGGWLVVETWMNWELVSGTNAKDQWTFDQTAGAAAKLQNHWASWFTEKDMANIAAWGLNS